MSKVRKTIHGFTHLLRRNGCYDVDYEDVLQESVTRFLEGKRNTFDPTRGELAAYIRGICKSVLSTWIKHSIRGYYIESPVTYEFERPDLEFENNENAKVLFTSALLAANSDKSLVNFAEAILYGAYKRKDIAEDLGWSEKAVSAARIKLQRRMRRVEANGS